MACLFQRTLVAQLAEQQQLILNVVCSIPTLVTVFLSSFVGQFAKRFINYNNYHC